MGTLRITGPMSRPRTDRHDQVLNLCFHGVGSPERPLEPDEDQYWLRTDRFEEILEVIRKYSSTRISFDDGNASDVTEALPALLARDLHGVFFVIADRLDRPGSLARREVQTLIHAGMGVGSHGMYHRPFRTLDDAELQAELVDAGKILAQVAGQPAQQLACPFGSYDRRVLNAARRYGFKRVYTVDGGPAKEGAWLQSRYTVRCDDTAETIERLLASPRGSALALALRSGKSGVKRLR
jgi:peptidoglycan/xylan/chitin deacetylase (PgdA/CDA1 family)